MRTAILGNRGVLRITGEDAKKLLDGILTCDLDKVTPEKARLGALLSPQGKILFDFLIVAAPDGEAQGYYLDCPRGSAADFAKRLNFYKLRAKMLVENLSDTHRVSAMWDMEHAPATSGIVFQDPRLEALGFRSIAPVGDASELDASEHLAGATDSGSADYLAHRLSLGIPDAAEDFGLADLFPHEMMMDQLAGVDFDKGCYVGQEVVSRMQHRATARTRVMSIAFEGMQAPAKGSEMIAGGKVIGSMGSCAGGRAVALIRIDRASDALAEGTTMMADGIGVTIEKPAYARFDFPVMATAKAG